MRGLSDASEEDDGTCSGNEAAEERSGEGEGRGGDELAAVAVTIRAEAGPVAAAAALVSLPTSLPCLRGSGGCAASPDDRVAPGMMDGMYLLLLDGGVEV